MRYFIIKGRFQPFHYGHLQVVQSAITLLQTDDVLVLAAMCPFDLDIGIVDKTFAESAAEHRLPERNPWGAAVALIALNEVAMHCSESKRRIITTMMPYPNLAWPVVKTWFPQNRTWVIPKSSEKFDDIKAQFYLSQNEEVIRVADNLGISGRELRESFLSHDIEKFKKGIPEFLHGIYV